MEATSRRDWLAQLLGLATATLRLIQAATPQAPVLQRRFSISLVDGAGAVATQYPGSYNYFTEDLGEGVTFDMAIIPGGSYDMGSTYSLPAATAPFETPVHSVTVKPFALCTTPATIGFWKRASSLPQVNLKVHQSDNTNLPLEEENSLPMDYVSWPEVVEIMLRLKNYTGRSYRFPTEAEWEYACKAGTTTRFHFGDAISLQVANYNDGNVRPLRLKPVGSKQCPNRFGLHDMHGNVLEWCPDWIHNTYDGAPSDGSVWDYSAPNPLSRIGRGGSFLFRAEAARSAYRFLLDVREQATSFGFRLALDFPSSLIDPTLARNGISNAASGVTTGLAPGTIVAIRGENIGPATPLLLALDERKKVSTELQGTQVLFDGVPAPLLYVSAQQINAVAPYSIAGKTSTQLVVISQGQGSLPVTIPVKESSPGLFTVDSSGRGQAAALNQDGSYNSSALPAARGSIVSLFGTGEGLGEPVVEDGRILESLTRPRLPVSVTIGGQVSEVQYAGGAPGLVAGVLQLNVRIPDAVAAGAQEVVVKIGGESCPPGVIISVK